MTPLDFMVGQPIADSVGWVDVDRLTLQHKKYGMTINTAPFYTYNVIVFCVHVHHYKIFVIEKECIFSVLPLSCVSTPLPLSPSITPNRSSLSFSLSLLSLPPSLPSLSPLSSLPPSLYISSPFPPSLNIIDNIFSLGDCSSVPTSKTAAAVAAEAGVLKHNLLQVMKGHTPTREVCH